MNRARAIAYIDRVATDGDLLRLTATLRHWKSVEDAETKKLDDENAPSAKSFFMATRDEEGESQDTHATNQEINPARANTSPGEPSITKIGSKTKDELLQTLKEGRQPPDKYSEHLKLLWQRGEVKFDGKVFYV